MFGHDPNSPIDTAMSNSERTPAQALRFGEPRSARLRQAIRRLGQIITEGPHLSSTGTSDSTGHDQYHEESEVESWSRRSVPTTSSPKPAATDSTPVVDDTPVSVVVVDADFDHYGDIEESRASTADGLHRPASTSGSHPLSHSHVSSGRRRNVFRAMADFVTHRAWPAVHHVMFTSFNEKVKESQFQVEVWGAQKLSAFACTLLMILAWVVSLCVGWASTPYGKYAYAIGMGIITVPLPVMVALNGPLRFPFIYQTTLFVAVWSWPVLLTIQMDHCRYFSANQVCNGPFTGLFGVLYGVPTLAILAMRQTRFLSALGMIAWLVAIAIAITRAPLTHRTFAKSITIFVLYESFVIMISYTLERSNRRLFELRQQLKMQYRAVQSAQVMERRAEQSKKRFVSYIFHEVRVPLNTALLACQNLEAEAVFKDLNVDQNDMVQGLLGSLAMMEKVLNDVLSFNRMDSGRFSLARKPFDFHKALQIAAMPYRGQAEAKRLAFGVDLDPRIDILGHPFIGDEMRLRQVVSNLMSNALKFTPTGSVKIVTRLLLHRETHTGNNDSEKTAILTPPPRLPLSPIPLRHHSFGHGLVDAEKGSVKVELARIRRHSLRDSVATPSNSEKPTPRGTPPRPPLRPLLQPTNPALTAAGTAVVRVEIHDTGVGLRARDIAEDGLFSPFVQTEIGQKQGGKGSGLGLALVRQIVTLSRGRLGVESRIGEGSIFWFELPFSLSGLPLPDATTDRFLHGTRVERHRTPEVTTPEDVPQSRFPPPAPLRLGSDTIQLLASEGSLPSASLSSPGVPGIDSPMQWTPLDVQRTSVSWSPRPPSDVSQVPSIGSPGTMPSPTTVPPPGAAVPQTSDHNTESSAPTRLSTLVVDDDPLTRKLMSRMLRRLGHDVTTAENGKVCLELLRSSFERRPGAKDYDIVFLDNQMPFATGVEVTRVVRELGSDIFIVGCTGNALSEDQAEYLDAGVNHIITKPVHQSSIIRMIDEAKSRMTLGGTESGIPAVDTS